MQKTKVDKKVVPADYSYFQYLEIHISTRNKKTRNKKTQKKAMGLAKLNEGVKLPQNITILVSHGDNHGVSGMAVGWPF